MAVPKPKHDDQHDEERDPEQAWFWSERWQAEMREAEEDIREGRVEEFDSMEEFLDSLDDD